MGNVKIGFIGFGQMGSALANGMVKHGDNTQNKINVIKKENIFYHTRKIIENEYKRLCSNIEVANTCDIIICAIKPNSLFSVLKEIKNAIKGKLVISICAGIRLSAIEEILGDDQKIIRVMPNTPCMVGEGVCSFCVNANVTEQDKQQTINIFKCCGMIEEANEDDIDALTAVVGSGPAYVFLFIESLIDAAVKNGIARETAKTFVLKTIKGSVKMVENADEPIQKLKDNVCSPGGTTIHGLSTLEKHHFKYSIIDAVDTACEVSRRLSKSK